jgi:ABC-type transport system involved in cytochrome c biogenesis permease subunit
LTSAVYIALVFYLISSITFFWSGFKNSLEKMAFSLAAAGLAFNLVILVMRGRISGRLPLSSGYDFLLTFIFITVLMFLIYAAKYPVRNAGGPVIMIAALLLSAAAFIMPDKSSGLAPLPPALRSPWLTVHVLTAAASYSGFTLAAGLAAVQLHKLNQIREETIYRVVSLSFALLSLSIVFGAVWAEQAWGSYWSWDPKETWALVTWIVYAVYLHLHRQSKWRGKPANLMVVAGFIIVLFTFFGVTYLFSGMHSYS